MTKRLFAGLAGLALCAAGGLAALGTARADEAARATPGSAAAAFSLQDTTGTTHTLEQYKGKVVVLEWFNPDCPFVKKHHMNAKTMKDTAEKYAGRDVVWLAINSGSAGKQGSGLERNVKAKADYGIPYPVLMDPTGATGRAYGAVVTPHMFVIDRDGKIAYNGAIDDDRSANKVGRNLVAAALDAVLEGKPVETATSRPYGCSVKY